MNMVVMSFACIMIMVVLVARSVIHRGDDAIALFACGRCGENCLGMSWCSCGNYAATVFPVPATDIQPKRMIGDGEELGLADDGDGSGDRE